MRLISILVTIFMVLIFSCETTDTSFDDEALTAIKTIAVVDFTSDVVIESKAKTEAQNTITSAFVKSRFKVLERNKIAQLLKEQEFTVTFGNDESIEKVGKLLGADALLFGSFTKNSQKNIVAIDENGNEYDTKKFEFKLDISLVSVLDGSILFTASNSWDSHTNDPRFIQIDSLADFRSQVLQAMSEDITKQLKKIKDKK